MACLLNQTGRLIWGRHRNSFLKTDLDSEFKKLFVGCLVNVYVLLWTIISLSLYEFFKTKVKYVSLGINLSIIQF